MRPQRVPLPHFTWQKKGDTIQKRSVPENSPIMLRLPASRTMTYPCTWFISPLCHDFFYYDNLNNAFQKDNIRTSTAKDARSTRILPVMGADWCLHKTDMDDGCRQVMDGGRCCLLGPCSARNLPSRAFHSFSWSLPCHVHTEATEILCVFEAFRSPPFLIVYLKLEDEPHFFPNVIWANLHDTRSNKWVLNYVWSPLMGRSLFGKCDLINYWVCFLWQIERHSPTLALHILLIRGR